MAIYHHSIKIISRGKGKSAVAAAAYRSGETITNEYDGITHDYTRKGGIAHTEILLPDNAPSEYQDRAVLWNAVEKSERNRNAQLAREIELALPVELSAGAEHRTCTRLLPTPFCGGGNVRRHLHTRQERRKPTRAYHAHHAPDHRERQMGGEIEKGISA
jgi:hypothetical protein